MASYSRDREEDHDRRDDGSQYSNYGNGNVAPQWGQHVDAPKWNDEAHSRFYANDRSPAWEQEYRQVETVMAENAELRRDLIRSQRTSLQLLDTQKESTERIRELQDSNYGLQEEVANMRAQLAFATGNIINEIQDKVDAATFADSTVRALKQQITEQTETIEKLKIQKRKAVTELSQVQLQMKKKKRSSSKSTKSEKKKRSGKHSASSDANTAVAPSLITAPGQAPSLVSSAQVLVEKELAEDVMRDRVIRDAHLTSGVEVQLQEALLKANVGSNMRGFIDRGKPGCYYCFHEVCEKGPDAWVEQRLANGGCKLGSDKCNFLVKAVSVGSHRRLQIYNPAVVTSA